jgi:hypothetical protein
MRSKIGDQAVVTDVLFVWGDEIDWADGCVDGDVGDVFQSRDEIQRSHESDPFIHPVGSTPWRES